jgi:hypothetical protein
VHYDNINFPGPVAQQTVAATRALVPADDQTLILVDSAAAVTINLDDLPDTPFWCEIVRFGTGTVTFAQTGAAPILSAGGLLDITAQYNGVTVTRTPSGWLLVGALS